MDIFKPQGRFTRRSFLARTAQVGTAVAFPTIIPSHVLAKPGRIGPNDKIRIATIGMGIMVKESSILQRSPVGPPSPK